MPGYAELQVCSNYSFLRGASRIEELLLQAKVLGLDALAITDHNTLAGIARAHARAAELGVRLVVGCRLDLRDNLPILAYPLDCTGYGRLCRLLTLGKGRTGKGGCDIAWADLEAAGDGLLLILLPDEPDERLIACHGRVQREGEVIHVITEHLEDLSSLLRTVGNLDSPFPLRHGRGDGATHPAARDPRDGPSAGPGGRQVRDIFVPDLRIGSGIKIPTRDFR